MSASTNLGWKKLSLSPIVDNGKEENGASRREAHQSFEQWSKLSLSLPLDLSVKYCSLEFVCIYMRIAADTLWRTKRGKKRERERVTFERKTIRCKGSLRYNDFFMYRYYAVYVCCMCIESKDPTVEREVDVGASKRYVYQRIYGLNRRAISLPLIFSQCSLRNPALRPTDFAPIQHLHFPSKNFNLKFVCLWKVVWRYYIQ